MLLLTDQLKWMLKREEHTDNVTATQSAAFSNTLVASSSVHKSNASDFKNMKTQCHPSTGLHRSLSVAVAQIP